MAKVTTALHYIGGILGLYLAFELTLSSSGHFMDGRAAMGTAAAVITFMASYLFIALGCAIPALLVCRITNKKK